MLSELYNLIEKFGEPRTEYHENELGIYDAVKVLNFFDNGGCVYFFQRAKEWVSVQTVYTDKNCVLWVSYFAWGENETLEENGECRIDRFMDFARIERECISKKAKEIWQK